MAIVRFVRCDGWSPWLRCRCSEACALGGIFTTHDAIAVPSERIFRGSLALDRVVSAFCSISLVVAAVGFAEPRKPKVKVDVGEGRSNLPMGRRDVNVRATVGGVFPQG
jgi:hypothetical protein